MFNFEKLDAWQHAIEFADLIYSTTRSFPADEGSSRSSKTDFARFVEIAAGSLFEVVSQSVIARRQGFLNEAAALRIYENAERQGRMPSGPRNSLLA